MIIDAIFGAGLTRSIQGSVASLIESINALRQTDEFTDRVSILSIDLPSGINGDSGNSHLTENAKGTPHLCAIKADYTISFFRPKPAHFLYPGRAYCGELTIADIAIPNSVLEDIQPQIHENTPQYWQTLFPIRNDTTHKYQRGHLLIASGTRYSTGAARLSAIAALRAGAGLVTLVSPTDAMDILAAHCTEIMLQAVDSVTELEQLFEDKRLKSIVIGPGFGVGEKCKQFVVTALKHCNTVVLDADALMSFTDSTEPDTKSLLASINASNATVVLTPHEGEFNKLALSCGLDSHTDANETKLTRTLALAAASGAYVVHKGADTVIASPTGESVLSVHGQPWLATAGSGDVLAGTIASILMQGRNNPLEEYRNNLTVSSDETLMLVAAAVWKHSEASQRLGPGLIAGDLPAVYPDILTDLYTMQP